MITYNFAIRLHDFNKYELLVDVETTDETLIGFDTFEEVEEFIEVNNLEPYFPETIVDYELDTDFDPQWN